MPDFFLQLFIGVTFWGKISSLQTDEHGWVLQNNSIQGGIFAPEIQVTDDAPAVEDKIYDNLGYGPRRYKTEASFNILTWPWKPIF